MKDMRTAPFDAGLPRIVRRPRRIVQTIPTGNIRHLPAIRGGKVNYEEVFSRKVREAIPVDPDVVREKNRGRGKAIVTDAAEKLLEGREKSQARDAKNIQKQEKSGSGVLRNRKQTRKGKVAVVENKQRVQKPQENKPPKVKAQKGRTPQKPKVKKKFVKRQMGDKKKGKK